MAIIEGWLPPTRENYDLILKVWQISYPIIGSMQWLTSWYGMGKTSVASRLNLPGRIGWLTMEAPGFLTLLYLMKVLPEQHGIDDLPWQNKVLAGLFSSILQFSSGILIFYLGLSGNFFHDEELRDIRRREAQRQERAKLENNGHASKGVEKHYQIPQAGLFRYVLYPHYLCEWIEWAGFWMAAGWGCAPARAFLVNEMFAMFPRAVRGRRWYLERFGEDKVGRRWAVIPGVW
ncbi:hypothetical protein IL306_014899 [Fusarium sp. DS 682]|nr:hypothetical protein IL306_014899 [Fusarium sp. DS 682]